THKTRTHPRCSVAPGHRQTAVIRRRGAWARRIANTSRGSSARSCRSTRNESSACRRHHMVRQGPRTTARSQTPQPLRDSHCGTRLGVASALSAAHVGEQSLRISESECSSYCFPFWGVIWPSSRSQNRPFLRECQWKDSGTLLESETHGMNTAPVDGYGEAVSSVMGESSDEARQN